MIHKIPFLEMIKDAFDWILVRFGFKRQDSEWDLVVGCDLYLGADIKCKSIWIKEGGRLFLRGYEVNCSGKIRVDCNGSINFSDVQDPPVESDREIQRLEGHRLPGIPKIGDSVFITDAIVCDKFGPTNVPKQVEKHIIDPEFRVLED